MLEYNYKNALGRLMLYNICCKYEFTNTMLEISESFSIPLAVIREDFVLLFERSALIWSIDFKLLSEAERSSIKKVYECFYEMVSETSDFEEADIEALEEVLNAEPDTNSITKELILSGIMDRYHFSMYTCDNINNELISIPVNIEEYLAYYNLFEVWQNVKKVSDEKTLITSTIRNKKYLCDLKPSILEKLYDIEGQIKSDRCLKFDYTPFGGHKTIDNRIKPLKIGFDATENRYVVISAHDGRIYTHDVECMEKIVTTKNVPSDPDLINKIPYDKVWGFEYNECLDSNNNIAEPIRIKAMFYNNEANVINKAKRDLEYRNPINLYNDEAGNLIYEDDVYGKDSFIRWVLSYGSSVRILKPQKIIDEIVGILKASIPR